MNKIPNRALTVPRGRTSQLSLIHTGELLNSARHWKERIYTIAFTHSADGAVTVNVVDDMPHNCRPHLAIRSGRYSYRRPIESDKPRKLLARERNENVWKIWLGETGRYVELTPGETLLLRHFDDESCVSQAA